MIKAVIFDMDGVIIDSEPLYMEADRMVMRDYGKTISDVELFDYIGVPNPVIWKKVREKHGLDASVQELMDKQSYYRDHLLGDGEFEPVAGIINLLEELRSKGLKIGLASSSAKKTIERVLNSLGIAEYFEAVISGEDVKNSKPAPDIFLKTAETLNIEPSKCVVIEDSAHGVNAAKRAGMYCIGFYNPNSGRQDLSPADVIVNSIEEIDIRNY